MAAFRLVLGVALSVALLREARFQVKLDEKLRFVEAKIKQEATLDEVNRRHLATVKSNMWLTKKVRKLLKKASLLARGLASFATSSDLSDLETRVSTVETNVTTLDTDAALCATSPDLSDLKTRVSTVETDIATLETDVALCATSSDLSVLETRVSTVETAVKTLDTSVQSLRMDLDDALADDAEPAIQPFETRDDLDRAIDAYFDGLWMGYLDEVYYGKSISDFDVSLIEDFSGLFASRYTFNEPLNAWQTVSATNMAGMFYLATSFNQPLGSWSVGKVTSMKGMFVLAESFTGATIDGWDVSNCETVYGMFKDAKAFEGPVGSWNVEKVTDMEVMFASAEAFNDVTIANWNPVSVTTMNSMFAGANSFNVDISEWNVSSVKDMSDMFRDAASFSQDLCAWGGDLEGDTSVDHMFDGTACSSQEDPSLAATPRGPFCAGCTST